MKKFIAMVLSLVLILSLVSNAFAAETYTTNEAGRTYEKVRMAITRDGHIAAVKTLKSGYSTLKPFAKEEIEKISHLKNSGIIRGKGLIKGSLDERNMLAESSTIATLALEVVNLEQLQQAIGYDVVLNAVTVMDAASIYHNGHIGHRAVDRPTNLVAKFHQQNGSTINVFYDMFDGQRKLVFDAEAISTGSTGGNGGTTTPPAGNGSNSNGGNGGTDFTISGEANTDFTIGGTPSDTTSSPDHAGWSSDLTSTSGTNSAEDSGNNNTSSAGGWSEELTGGSTSNAGSTGGWSEELTGGGNSTESSTSNGTDFSIDD